MIIRNYLFLIIFFVIGACGITDSILDLMFKETLEKIMKCPAIRPPKPQPVVAFSPGRYIQFITQLRHDTEEISCNTDPAVPFQLNNPMGWGFCAMGICSEKKCYCYESFNGDRCEKFDGHCWLMYCHLVGCNDEKETQLACVCNPNLYGKLVTSGEYWYDDGLKHSYQDPPPGFPTTTFMGSKIIYSISKERYEVRGANYNKYKKKPTPNIGNKRHQRQNPANSQNIFRKTGNWQWIDSRWQWVTPPNQVVAPAQFIQGPNSGRTQQNQPKQYFVMIPDYKKDFNFQLPAPGQITQQGQVPMPQRQQLPASNGQRYPSQVRPPFPPVYNKLHQFPQKSQPGFPGQGQNRKLFPPGQIQKQAGPQLQQLPHQNQPIQQPFRKLGNNQLNMPVISVTELKEEFIEGKGDDVVLQVSENKNEVETKKPASKTVQNKAYRLIIILPIIVIMRL